MDDPSATGLTRHYRLQQELVSARDRLDRQILQLSRLNALSNRLLTLRKNFQLAEVFAEAISDVLDVAVGAVWLFGSHAAAGEDAIAVFGHPTSKDRWASLGRVISLQKSNSRFAPRFLEPEWMDIFSELNLVDPIVCECVGRRGELHAVLLGANNLKVQSMFPCIEHETLGMLKLLAEKFAAHLDNLSDQRLIQEQVERLTDSEERLGLILQGTNDGWWDWNVKDNTCFVSSRWLELVSGDQSKIRAYSQFNASGKTLAGFWYDAVHEDERSEFEYQLSLALRSTAANFESEIRLRCENGVTKSALVRGMIVRDSKGSPVRFAGSLFDLTEQKRYESHINHLAFFDPLTELPNRRLLKERVLSTLGSARSSREHLAVMVIDLDRFKRLNDRHGHLAGDQLLRAMSQRLRELVRPSDTVARLGGDEFVVLLANLDISLSKATETAQNTAARILKSLQEPFLLDIGISQHTGSIGVVVSDGFETDPEHLIRSADIALYAAKEGGRNCIKLFEPEMRKKLEERSHLELSISDGFKNAEFEVFFQAQLDVQGQLAGAEALMRWHHAGQRISPSIFIPLAEETGFINQLDSLCLEVACRQMKVWEPLVPSEFRIAVNLSAAEFYHPEFAMRVEKTLSETGLSGSRLRLEVTEATAINDFEFVAQTMKSLRDRGVEFSLDDFGTGYSSLNYLRRLPVVEVKIDRTYVHEMESSVENASVVRAMILMCKALDLRVVAEGVETSAQMKLLKQFGCDYFQGFLMSRPCRPSANPEDLLEAPWRKA